MKKSLQLSIALLCAAALAFSNNSSYAASNSNKETNVIINNVQLTSKDIILKNNLVFISLTAAKALDDLTFQWNNVTKQVSVKGNDTNLLLTMNKTTAQKNGVSVKLSTAPFIYNGKTMIPLRFVTEAMNSSVTWNQSTQTAFITKASLKLISDFKNDQLSTARNAAINMPRASQLSEKYGQSLDTSSLQYYFPEKVFDQFIEVNNKVINYYQISNNTSYLKWQGLVGDKASTQDNLYFVNRTITNEVGTLPSFKDTTFANFRWMPHIGSTGYSLINKENWNDVIFKEEQVQQSKVNENYIIVDIPEE
jgi:hypothetical protein